MFPKRPSTRFIRVCKSPLTRFQFVYILSKQVELGGELQELLREDMRPQLVSQVGVLFQGAEYVLEGVDRGSHGGFSLLVCQCIDVITLRQTGSHPHPNPPPQGGGRGKEPCLTLSLLGGEIWGYPVNPESRRHCR